MKLDLSHDIWYSLSLDEARPDILKMMYWYVTGFKLIGGKYPQTDGKKITLQQRIAEFKDAKEPLHDNRNMSLFLSDALHELLHIRECSFAIDGRDYIASFPNASLAQVLLNVVEDARIEHNAKHYLKPNHQKLLLSSNQFLAKKKLFPVGLETQVIEIFGNMMIVKDLPSRFINCKDKEDKVLETRVAEKVQSFGIYTVKDLITETISIASGVYDAPVQATWKVLPELYDLITSALPNVEEQFPQSGFSLLKAPKFGSEKSNSGSSPSKTKGDSSSKNLPDHSSNSSEDRQSESSDSARSSEQHVLPSFRGDIHDFSSAGKKAETLEEAIGDYLLQTPAGVGPTDSSVSPKNSGVSVIVTYNHLLKAYTEESKLKIMQYSARSADFLKTLDKYSDLRRNMIEHFELLKPNQLQRRIFSEDPDELNMEAVIEVLADPGLRDSVRIFDSYFINQRNTLWGILLDISGSTDAYISKNVRIIDVEKIAAGLLCQALTEVGDKVLMYAFSSNSNLTNLYEVPELSNLGALQPEYGNADGVAIRGVRNQLISVDAMEKKLIVISDGKPVGIGFRGADPVIDTSMAFMETESEQIQTVYFNVDINEPTYFSVLTRNTTFAKSIRDVTQLPSAIEDYVMSFC